MKRWHRRRRRADRIAALLWSVVAMGVLGALLEWVMRGSYAD